MTETAAIPAERPADLMLYMLDDGNGQPARLFFELDERIDIPAMRHAVAEASLRFPFDLGTLAAHDESLWVRTGGELCDVPEDQEIDTGIAVDGRGALGCPDSQRHLVNLLHLRYGDALRKSPLDVVNAKFRSSLAEQAEPQNLLNLFSRIRDGRRYLQSIPDLETRLNVLRRANKDEARTSTFSVSYGARLDLDTATEHIRAIRAVAAPYPLVVEIACIGSRFFFSFNQAFKSDRYARAFCAALDELGIPASYDGTEGIPPVPFTIPKQEA